ncbi:hypothetical protein QCB44_01555 [Thiomicrorhabdus sp. zzn3]|uniref:hypothetical protein n=1 Tax=Thiomicrorhabdus sp. zzn3 TaxID=3039775 RepID=UPI0024368086|nr:hypothetical protein [Thiomicrorhabdus sp. zzn3]MDG6777384.1 hypothetical protein [Thiomicrorhabdus sp. zzn3]
MRVALCISGQMRSFEECYPSQYQNLIEIFQPDVFIHTWSDLGQSIREKVASDVITPESLDNKLSKLYAPKRMVIEDYHASYCDLFHGVKVPEVLKEAEPVSYKGALPMFYKIWACNQLCLEYALEVGIKYDLVIRLRPDLYIDEPLSEFKRLVGRENELLLGHLTDVFASDRIAAGSPEAMSYYCCVWERLEQYWQNPLQDGNKNNHLVGERLMRWHLRWSKLEYRSMRALTHIKRYDESISAIRKKLFKKKVKRFFRELVGA